MNMGRLITRRPLSKIVAISLVSFTLSVCYHYRAKDVIQYLPDCIDTQIYKLPVANEDHHVHQFEWVCIQSQLHFPIDLPKFNEPRFWYIGESKVQMPAKDCRIIPQKRITLHGMQNKIYSGQFQGFWIERSMEDIPSDFTMSNDTAIFLGRNNLPFEPEGFFHFVKQIFFPLHYITKSAKQLNSGRSRHNNVIFYNSPLGRCPGKFSRFKLDYVKSFYELLNVPDPYTSAFEDIPNPDKVCYRNATFSDSVHLDHAYDAVEFIMESFHAAATSCQPRLVTLVDRRSYRRILNIDDLAVVARNLGYNTKIAHFEDMTFPEQAQLIHCTDILVGVNGGGMQWATFLKNYSGVVEIAWPQFDWPFFYAEIKQTASRFSDLHGVRPLRFARLEAEKCHLNPDAINVYYETVFHVPSNFTREESLAIIKDKRNYDFYKDGLISAGKFCDVTVKPEEFKKALLRTQQCDY